MAMKPCKECKTEVSTSAKMCPHCGLRYPTGGLTTGAKLGLVLIGTLVGLYLLGSLMGEDRKRERSVAQRTESNAPPASVSNPFDLIDMLPAEAGNMRLARVIAGRGRGSYHIPTDEQVALGYYLWSSDRSVQAQVLATAATVECKRKVPEDYSRCERKNCAMVGGKSGYFYPEEGRNCVVKIKGESSRAQGAMIDWPGCTIKFKCGESNGRTKEDLLAVAEAVEAWALMVRTGNAPAKEIAFNRDVLRRALDNQHKAERLARE